MNKDEFKKIMIGVSDYYGKEVSENLIKIYWMKFKNESYSDYATAISKCIDDIKWFPKVPEIAARLPEKPQLQHKGSLSWCDNTQRLINKYEHKYAGSKTKTELEAGK